MTMYGFMVTQAMVTLDENTELGNQAQIRESVQQLLDELEVCRPRRLDSMGAWFEYYLPSNTADANGNLVFGCYSADLFYPNGFYSVAFVRSNELNDLIHENTLANGGGTGVDLNNNGRVDDVFIGGNLVITPYDATEKPGRSAARMLYSARSFTAEVLNLDSAFAVPRPWKTTGNPPVGSEDVDSSSALTFPLLDSANYSDAAAAGITTMKYKGTTPIFLMRQLTGINCQKADSINDLNNDGVLDQSETYNDDNHNGVYDEADCEPFGDDNGNNIRDTLEEYVDTNHNGRYDCRMTLQVTTFDSHRSSRAEVTARDGFFGLRVMRTKIRFICLP